MKLIRNALAVGLLAGAAAIVACSGQLAPTTTGGSNTPNPGSAAIGGNAGIPEATDTTAIDAADDAIIDTVGIVTIGPPTGIVVDASVTIAQQGTYQCPTLDTVGASPAELISPELARISATTNPPGAPVLWSVAGVVGGCDSDTIGGFFGPDGGPSSSGDSLSFSCGSCVCGAVAITVQTQLDAVPPGQDASINVCNGAPFTSFSFNIVCEISVICFSPNPDYCANADGGTCGGGTCTNTQTDVNNCGACGTVCASGDICISGVCQTPLSDVAPTDAAGAAGEGDL